MRTHLLESLTAPAPKAETAPSDYERWRKDRNAFLAKRAASVVALYCIPCGRDIASMKMRELGASAMTRFAIEARDHDNTLLCGGPYEFVTYARKGKGERSRLENVPKADPRQLGQWQALVELLFQRLNIGPMLA
jgi:hypothetical protein